MKHIVLVIALLLAVCVTGSTQTNNEKLTATLRNAVGLLYAQDSSGGMSMRCTATAYEKTETGYKFVSAAHCIGDDNKTKEQAATGKDIPFYITRDEAGEAKTYYRAEVLWAGYQSRGEDFAVFHVVTTSSWNIIPLGDEHQEQVGSAITNIASPLGLGFQIFHGTITSVFLDRPIVDNRGINWAGTLLLQISSGPGSSGSALVSQAHENIIGFLVGAIGGDNIVGIPVSRFKAVEKAVADGKYKWWVKDTNVNPDGTSQ